MSRILVTGTGGVTSLGHHIACALQRYGHSVIGLTLDHNHELKALNHGYGEFACDVTKVASVEYYMRNQLSVDVLVNCAGIGLVKPLPMMTSEDFDDVMSVNAKGIFCATKACLDKLIASRGTVVNIVSSASHVPMTGSLAYNASKAAAHMMTLQMARELGRAYGITVFGVSPNRLKGTGMSRSVDEAVARTRGWTAREVEEKQIAAMPAGEETEPKTVAEFIAYLLQSKAHHKYLQGCVLPYGA